MEIQVFRTKEPGAGSRNKKKSRKPNIERQNFKSEIRSTKYEKNSKIKISMTETKDTKKLNGSAHFFFRKEVMSFKHGHYHQTILKHLINNAVVSFDQFTDIIAHKFR